MGTIQSRRKIVWLAIVSMLAIAFVAATREAAYADDGETVGKAPTVSLDKLLTIPSSVKLDVDRRGGATRVEWRTRFEEATTEVVQAQKNLDESLSKMSELASEGGNWRVAAPGQQAAVDDTTPMSFGLKQQIRRDREAVERAERDLVELKVKANLTGVPNEWWMDQ